MASEQTLIPMLNLRDEYLHLKTEIDAAVGRVLESGTFIGGPEIAACEQELASFLGVKHAVALNSGSDALVIALHALDIGPGDEVITTPYSFFATAEAISRVGATPVFSDIHPGTLNINAQDIQPKITKRTKAILPVHLFGLPADLSAISDIAKKYNLYVIEDCAQAFGSKFNDQMTGSIGDFGAYSFFPSKNLGCYGDGGLIATNSDKFAQRVRKLATHGSRTRYQHEEIGYNSRLDAIQAAILRVKLKYVFTNIKNRQDIAQHYREGLTGLEGLILPFQDKQHTFNQFTIRLKKNRDEIQTALEQMGVSSAVYYPISTHKQRPYISENVEMIHAELATKEVLSLPICPYMKQKTVERVIRCFRETLKNTNR